MFSLKSLFGTKKAPVREVPVFAPDTDIPLNVVCLFKANGKTFVGCCINNVNAYEFVTDKGVMMLPRTANVFLETELGEPNSSEPYGNIAHYMDYVKKAYVVPFTQLEML